MSYPLDLLVWALMGSLFFRQAVQRGRWSGWPVVPWDWKMGYDTWDEVLSAANRATLIGAPSLVVCSVWVRHSPGTAPGWEARLLAVLAGYLLGYVLVALRAIHARGR